VHIVVAGDTLTKIARQYYGTSLRWAEIYEANRDQLPNERALAVGMKLVIP
jgi:nucleoid-associated protein YgaU